MKTEYFQKIVISFRKTRPKVLFLNFYTTHQILPSDQRPTVLMYVFRRETNDERREIFITFSHYQLSTFIYMEFAQLRPTI